MSDMFYSLKPIIPYLILFPILVVLLVVFLFMISRRGIQSYNAGLYGLFYQLDNIKTISLSFLILFLFSIIGFTFIRGFSIYHLLVMMVLVSFCNIIIRNKIYLILGNVFVLFVAALLYFKNIFVMYLLYVDKLFYIQILVISIDVFVLFSSLFYFLLNFNVLFFGKDKLRVIKKRKKINLNG